MKYYICEHCHNIYSTSQSSTTEIYYKAVCPNINCKGHDDNEMDEIDELLVPAINELNKVGLYTESSCSGHLTDSSLSYIMLEPIKLTDKLSYFLIDLIELTNNAVDYKSYNGKNISVELSVPKECYDPKCGMTETYDEVNIFDLYHDDEFR